MLLFSSHKRLITSAFNCHPSGLFPRSIALLFCLASRGKQNKKVVTFSTMGILCKWAAFVPFFLLLYIRKKKKSHVSPIQFVREQRVVSFHWCASLPRTARQTLGPFSGYFVPYTRCVLRTTRDKGTLYISFSRDFVDVNWALNLREKSSLFQ